MKEMDRTAIADSRKSKRLICIACGLTLVIIVILLLLFDPKILNRFVSFIGNKCLMIGIIFIAFFIGFVSSVMSIIRINKDKRTLNDNRFKNIHGIKTLEAIRNDISEKDGSESHVRLRLDALLAASQANKEQNDKQQEGVAKGKAPLTQLRDLHELTMQNEFSKLTSSSMLTIISFLLILGILGTLSGVHELINQERIDISKLGSALKPSAYAVAFTVILLIMRGVYLCMVDLFVAALDFLTLHSLIPELTRDGTGNRDGKSDIEGLEVAKNAIENGLGAFTLIAEKFGESPQQGEQTLPSAATSVGQAELKKPMENAAPNELASHSPEKDIHIWPSPVPKLSLGELAPILDKCQNKMADMNRLSSLLKTYRDIQTKRK